MILKNYLIIFLFLILDQKSQEKFPYQLRDADAANRYEGQKSLNVSAPDLELLSFTGCRASVPKGADVNLGLMFFLQEDAPLYITAKEIVPYSFYLMKPVKTKWKSGWNTFHPWPTHSVINPLSIDIDGVGIVGRLHKDRLGSGFIVPMVLYMDNTPKIIDSYTIHMKPKQSLSEIEYKVFRKGDNVPIVSNCLRGTFFAQRDIPITFEFKDQEEGEYIINVQCRIKNSVNGPTRTYRFYHRPTVAP